MRGINTAIHGEDDMGDALIIIGNTIDEEFGAGYAIKNPVLMANVYLGVEILAAAKMLASAIEKLAPYDELTVNVNHSDVAP